MTERNPTPARFRRFVVCFVAFADHFIAWSDFKKFVFMPLMLVSPGGVKFSMATPNVVFVLGTILLAVMAVPSRVR